MITVESALADLLDVRDRADELADEIRQVLKADAPDMRSQLYSIAARLDHIVSDIDSE
jgi:hypothetical protein